MALVIGNSTYLHTRVLTNPKNDAESIAKVLREMGFEDVSLRLDLDYRTMRESVRNFSEAAREADVALIYFAGHGLEVAGENYLLPTDARLARDADLEYEAVTLASVLNAAGGARRLRLVILDACRNNPLGERIALKTGVIRAVTRGLARIEPMGDVLVAYAAKAGTVAEDGTGKHSPYAEALLKHMPTPGLDVRLMFGKVRDAVIRATRQKQEPYTYGSLTGDVVALVPGTPLTKAQQIELTFWISVKDSTSPAVLSTYLDRYPNGEFAPIARALIEHYEQQAKLDLAKREEERKRAEAALHASELKRLEEERLAREAALGEEKRRAEEAKDAEATKKLEEKQRVEALAMAESVQKMLQEEAAAREAAKLAEDKRVATAKAAEKATKHAEETIATKLEATKKSNPAKIAALPKIEGQDGVGRFDGAWTIAWRCGYGCNPSRCTGSSYGVTITGGRISGGGKSGSVSSAGSAQWTHTNRFGAVTTSVSLRGSTGRGRWANTSGCTGTLTASRR